MATKTKIKIPKTAAKKTKAPKAPKAARRGKNVLVFYCDGVCTVTDDQKSGQPNSTMHFLAIGTDAELTFRDSSPFKSGFMTIPFTSMTPRSEKLKITLGTFHYSYSCTRCGAGAGEADIFVEL